MSKIECQEKNVSPLRKTLFIAPTKLMPIFLQTKAFLAPERRESSGIPVVNTDIKRFLNIYYQIPLATKPKARRSCHLKMQHRECNSIKLAAIEFHRFPTL
jgi:hypothetical protein